MPSTRDIRRRIKSVKNTAQITKAMQMVAASKMRKAQMAALAGRPYAELMNKVLAEFTYKDAPLFAEARVISKFVQELFLKREVDRVDIVFTNFISTLAQ